MKLSVLTQGAEEERWGWSVNLGGNVGFLGTDTNYLKFNLILLSYIVHWCN